MIKTLSLSITVAVSMAAVAQASIITLSGTRSGPLVIESSQGIVSNGLVRIGTLTGAPASSSVADIDAVFSEFGTSMTSDTGGLGTTVSNPAGTPFDNQQVFVWVFSGADAESSAEHAVFTVADANAPDTGNAWTFPVHTGTGADVNTVSLAALLTGADTSVTPGITFDEAASRLVLTPIPEPSGALLAGLAGALIAFRRRR